jgi:hypothetical protein
MPRKPVEEFHSAWTSTADLEETIAAMFNRPLASAMSSGATAPDLPVGTAAQPDRVESESSEFKDPGAFI